MSQHPNQLSRRQFLRYTTLAAGATTDNTTLVTHELHLTTDLRLGFEGHRARARTVIDGCIEGPCGTNVSVHTPVRLQGGQPHFRGAKKWDSPRRSVLEQLFAEDLAHRLPVDVRDFFAEL